jgi:hypothetical protein
VLLPIETDSRMWPHYTFTYNYMSIKIPYAEHSDYAAAKISYCLKKMSEGGTGEPREGGRLQLQMGSAVLRAHQGHTADAAHAVRNRRLHLVLCHGLIVG